jgi:hypothetical protein
MTARRVKVKLLQLNLKKFAADLDEARKPAFAPILETVSITVQKVLPVEDILQLEDKLFKRVRDTQVSPLPIGLRSETPPSRSTIIHDPVIGEQLCGQRLGKIGSGDLGVSLLRSSTRTAIAPRSLLFWIAPFL